MLTNPAVFVSPEALGIADESERRILQVMLASLRPRRSGVVGTKHATQVFRPIPSVRLLHLCTVAVEEMTYRVNQRNARTRARYAAGGQLVRDQKVVKKKERRERNHEFVLGYLKDKQCLDCGLSNPLLLDFDHVKGDKYHSIADLTANAASIRTITAEMRKCEVVCSNCHRRRTLTRQGSSFRIAEHVSRRPKIPLPVLHTDRGHQVSGILIVGPWGDHEARRGYYRDYRAQNLARCKSSERTSRLRCTVRNQDFVRDYLSQRCCMDCGESDLVVLEFDHVRGVKRTDISNLVRTGSLQTLQTEIDKCEVVCSNCHRRRTAHTRRYFRLRQVS